MKMCTAFALAGAALISQASAEQRPAATQPPSRSAASAAVAKVQLPTNPIAPGGEAGRAWIVGPITKNYKAIVHINVINPDPFQSVDIDISCHETGDSQTMADNAEVEKAAARMKLNFKFTTPPNGYARWSDTELTEHLPNEFYKGIMTADVMRLDGWCAVRGSNPIVVVATAQAFPGNLPTWAPQAVRVAP